MLKVASFFSGIGGFELGFETIGMSILFHCEVDKFNQQILSKHWPNAISHGDINTLTPCEIPECDIWCAGFPCQDVSLANNGKRQGLEGKRSGLFYEFQRLFKERLPKWIVLENVPGLLSSQKGEDFRTIIRALDEVGYGVAWRILDAKYFGTPQRRRRVFIVASYQSQNAVQVLFDNEGVELASQESRGQKEASTTGFRASNQEPIVYSIQNAAIGRIHSSGPQGRGYRCDGETWTFDSRGRGDAVCTPFNPMGIRTIAGVPAKLDRPRYISLGNAVNVLVAQWIGKRLFAVENLKNNINQQAVSTTSIFYAI